MFVFPENGGQKKPETGNLNQFEQDFKQCAAIGNWRMHIFLRMGPPCRMMDHCSVGFSSQSTLVPFRLLVHDKLPRRS